MVNNKRTVGSDVMSEVTSEEISQLIPEEEYQRCLDGCRQLIGLIVQTSIQAREYYWQLGKLVYEFIDTWDRKETYGKRVIARLSLDLGISETSLRYARRFYEIDKDGTFSSVLPNLSWTRTQQLLPLLRDEDRREEIRREADRLMALSDVEFRSWVDARRRRSGPRPIVRRLRSFVNSLRRRRENVVELREDKRGLTVVCRWVQGQDKGEVIGVLEEALSRLRG